MVSTTEASAQTARIATDELGNRRPPKPPRFGRPDLLSEENVCGPDTRYARDAAVAATCGVDFAKHFLHDDFGAVCSVCDRLCFASAARLQPPRFAQLIHGILCVENQRSDSSDYAIFFNIY